MLTFAGIDPVAYTFATVSGNAVLGFAEAEILYPSGTELLLEANGPVLTSEVYAPALPIASAADAPDLAPVVRRLPFRTKTKVGNKDSDITNLVFIGSPRPCSVLLRQLVGSPPTNCMPPLRFER